MAYNTIIPYSDDLLHLFGKGNVFFDKEILQLYGHDLSNPPFVIDYLIKRQPDAVCVAQNKEQVAKLLKLARDGGFTVTPAAGRTSAYGGSVPVKGGVVLDLSRLKKEIKVDYAAETVTCDPGVVILDLDRELNRYGLTLATYPTSAPSATIGGWVCQGGVGMGSFRHGPIATQVLACEVVLSTGETRQFSGNELDVVNEAMGTTGVVTQVTLKVVKRVERVPVLFAFDTLDQLTAALNVAAREFRPWNLTFHNPTFSQLREEAGGPKTVPRKKWSLLAVFDAPEHEKVKAAFQAAIEKVGGKMLPDATAKADWGEIFNTLRAKALGPSIAPGEAVFPLGKANEALKEINERFEYAALSIEGTIFSSNQVTVLAFALEDERRPFYPLGFAAGIGILRIAKKHGGRAYSAGTYLASEAVNVFGAQRYDRILTFKKAVDPTNSLNPGKIKGVPVRAKALLLGIPIVPSWAAPPGAPMSTVDKVLNAKPMTWAMGKIAPKVKYNRPVDERAGAAGIAKAMSAVQGSAFGAKHDWNVYKCSQCMFCRNVSPLSDAVGLEAGSPSGLIWWARLYLKGQLEANKRIGELVAAASEVPVGDEVCPSKIPLSEVFKDWKAQLEVDLGKPLAAPAALKSRIAASAAAMEETKKRWATPVAPPTPPAPAAPVKEKPAVPAKPAAPAGEKPPAAPPAAPVPKPAPAATPKPAA